MRKNSIVGLLAFLLTLVPAWASELEVPIYIQAGDGQAADCSTSTVSGLSATGNGYLSVRSGPGERYRELARLHNGEVVAIYEGRGGRVGVVYRTENFECSSRVRHKITAPRKGWISSKFLTPLAG